MVSDSSENSRPESSAQSRPPVADQHDQYGFVAADTLAEQQAFEDHGEGRETGETEGGDGHAADFDGDEETDPVAGQQHTAEQQAACVLAAEALPARAGQAGEQSQGEHGEGGAAKDDDCRAGAGGQLAEDAGKAEKQRANVQGA